MFVSALESGWIMDGCKVRGALRARKLTLFWGGLSEFGDK